MSEPKFILDVHLGKLARYLRMLGFDTLYENNYQDPEIVKIAEAEKRIVLTCDLELLKIKAVKQGLLIRSRNPVEQLTEVILHFNIYQQIKPFYRCLVCNGIIIKVAKETIVNRLPPETKLYYDEFYQCTACDKVYWKGSHHLKMKDFINKLGKKSPNI
ncbi:MAG TPA: Mut7-C RNAse domain-containing protein [archaeon]|nr:Mut7-C RNAse domain-containing protein [archaeon]